jgi:starch synthase
MDILHIASEIAPIAKVGGLADVIYGLSRELAKNKHRVEVLIPKYDCIEYGGLKHLKVEIDELWCVEGDSRYKNTIWSAELGPLKILLLEAHHPEDYFSRGTIYGCKDDNDRFAYFSKAALEYLLQTGKKPGVVHIHDWETSLIAPLYKDVYSALGVGPCGIVLTIHNLEHQGKCSPRNLSNVGLAEEEKMQDPTSPDLINLLKGGILYADAVTTVSPNYKKEILTTVGGCGLDEVLLANQHKLSGILNGIDETFWNPAKDPLLVKPYTTKKVLEGKAENRRHLRTHLGLEEKQVPLVASITRIVSQKGPDLIIQAIRRTLEKGGQFVFLGSSAAPEYEDTFQLLKKEFAGSKRVAICLDRDEPLAHLIFAAADLFVIPSLFEPCGLTQMIALRYGTIPVVRTTGGLADTVFDIDTSSVPLEERNGFTFDFPDAEGINWALDRALDCWANDRPKWELLMQQGMSKDFSWKHPAGEYVAIYEKMQPGTGTGKGMGMGTGVRPSLKPS